MEIICNCTNVRIKIYQNAMITKTIALVGDFNEQVLAHVAILKTIELVKKNLDIHINWQWLETDNISGDYTQGFSKFSAFWVVPGSPYKNMEGVLNAIRFARENNLPFLGTCGGFQHALIEYARNVCGVADADHAETNPDAKNSIIVPLECSLVEKTGEIIFSPESRASLVMIQTEKCEPLNYPAILFSSGYFFNLSAQLSINSYTR